MIGVSRSMAVALMVLITTAVSADGAFPQGTSSLLQHTARLEVRDVSLETALRELWQRSTVPLAFSPDLVNVNGPVSCSCVSATVQQALDTLLFGTGLRFEETRRRVIVSPIISRQAASQPSASPQVPQVRGWLVGEVRTTSDSQPIVGAHVVVSGLPGEARTDSRGRFRLRLDAGTYELAVRSLGYAPRELPNLQVTTGDTSRVMV